jgi:hypothetical protein
MTRRTGHRAQFWTRDFFRYNLHCMRRATTSLAVGLLLLAHSTPAQNTSTNDSKVRVTLRTWSFLFIPKSPKPHTSLAMRTRCW